MKKGSSTEISSKSIVIC